MPCLGCQPITSSATAAGNAGGARGVCPARRAEGSAPAGGRAGEPCAQRARGGGGGGGERGLLLPVSRRGGPWRSVRCVFVEDPASTALGRCRGVEWTVPSPGHVTRTEPALLRPLSTRSLWWLHAGPHWEPHSCLGLGAGSPAPPPPHRRIFTRAGLTGGSSPGGASQGLTARHGARHGARHASDPGLGTSELEALHALPQHPWLSPAASSLVRAVSPSETARCSGAAPRRPAGCARTPRAARSTAAGTRRAARPAVPGGSWGPTPRGSDWRGGAVPEGRWDRCPGKR